MVFFHLSEVAEISPMVEDLGKYDPKIFRIPAGMTDD
jgi:hypothetical protein